MYPSSHTANCSTDVTITASAVTGINGGSGFVSSDVGRPIRIFINNEIQELHAGLNQAFNLLRANGKICVVTFHSIEDRLVKNFTNKVCLRNKKTKLIKPSSKEILSNPRSRSAKLRVIKRERLNFNYIPISELGFEL